jgi:uncharacterized membrane protein
MEQILYIYLFIIVFCWTMNPFIKKIVLKENKLNIDEYFIINHLVVTAIIGVYFIYLFKEKKCSPNCIRNLSLYDYMYIFMGALTSILGARLMISIIKSEDISYVVANIQPMIIALTFIIGYLFFSENVTINKIIGIIFIIMGLIYINKK